MTINQKIKDFPDEKQDSCREFLLASDNSSRVVHGKPLPSGAVFFKEGNMKLVETEEQLFSALVMVGCMVGCGLIIILAVIL
jgi:hypothetical protein